MKRELDLDDRNVEDLKLGDTMHAGVFAGSRRFRRTQMRQCKLCGFEAYSPTHFALFNGCGVPTGDRTKSTPECMITQVAKEFDYLKHLTPKKLIV